MATEIKGIEQLVKRLEELSRLDCVKPVMKAAGLYIKGKIMVAPEVKRLTRQAVYGETFVSEAQRKFFFGALADGRIEVPYVRNSSPGSETITKKWTSVVSQDGLQVTVGNNVSYGPLLHGAEGEQSLYAEKVGWKRADQVIAEEESAVYGMIDTALRKECLR
jgi:hypothetical protein